MSLKVDNATLPENCRPPKCSVGDTLVDVLRGEVCVCGFSTGKLAWPLCQPRGGGSPRYIMCGSLVTLVTTSSLTCVSQLLQVPRSTICGWKVRLQSAGLASPRKWTHEMDALLGTRHDAEVGCILGRSRKSVQQRRSHLGIPKCMSPTVRGWTSEELATLGTLPDYDIAAKLGRRVRAVRWVRQHLGIPAACIHCHAPIVDRPQYFRTCSDHCSRSRDRLSQRRYFRHQRVAKRERRKASFTLQILGFQQSLLNGDAKGE